MRSENIDLDILIELSSKAGFVTPFLIACGTRNTKFSTIGIVCLQRLITSKALAKVYHVFLFEAATQILTVNLVVTTKGNSRSI